MEPLLHINLISTKEASELTGYNSDYLARLCRAGKIQGTQVGRTWLVSQKSLEEFVKIQDARKEELRDALSLEREKEYKQAQSPIARVEKKFSKKLPKARSVVSPFGKSLNTSSRASNDFQKKGVAVLVSLVVLLTSVYVAQAAPVATLAQNTLATALEISASVREVTGDTFMNAPIQNSRDIALANTNDISNNSLHNSAVVTKISSAVARSATAREIEREATSTLGVPIASAHEINSDASDDASSSFTASASDAASSVATVGNVNPTPVTPVSGIESIGTAVGSLVMATYDAPHKILSAYADGVQAWVNNSYEIPATITYITYDTGNSLGMVAAYAPKVAVAAFRGSTNYAGEIAYDSTENLSTQAPQDAEAAVGVVYGPAINDTLYAAKYGANQLAAVMYPELHLPIGQETALAVYYAINDFFWNTSSTVLTLLGAHHSNIAVVPTSYVIPEPTRSTIAYTTPVTISADNSYATNATSGTSTTGGSTANNTTVNVTNVNGVSQEYVDDSISALREFILKQADAIVSTGGGSNSGGGTTIIESNPVATSTLTGSSTLDELDVNGDVNVGSTTNLNGDVNVNGTTNLNGDVTIGGTLNVSNIVGFAFGGPGTDVAPFFVATSTTATSTFEGGITARNVVVTNISASNVTATGTVTSTNASSINSTSTNATSTNLYASNAHISNGIVDTLVSTLATIAGLNATNSTTTNATTTNFYATNGVINSLVSLLGNFTNLIAQNFTATNGTITNATSTNATSTNLYATHSIFGDILATIANFTSAVIGTLTATNAVITTSTTTSATSTNLFATNLTSTNATLGNATITNANTTNSTTTNATSTNAYSANFVANNGVISTLTSTNAIIASATTTSFFASLAHIANGTFDNFTSTLATIAGLTSTNSTSTNATSTNLFATNANLQNLTANNATLAGLTSTNATTTNLLATNGAITNAFINALTATGSSTLASLSIGNLTGVLHASNGYVSAGPISLATDIGGTLGVANGGTGSTTLTGLLKGNGTGVVQTAIAGTDYLAPSSLSSGSGISYNASTGVISNTGVTSNVAGSGITLSSTTGAVTITNSGVLSFNGRTGTVTPQLGDYTTSIVAEGTNLYYTNARADARIDATTTLGQLTSAPNLSSATSLTTIGTSLNGFLKATAGALSTSLINLSSDVTGVLPVSNGGTGTSSFATNGLLYGNGTNNLLNTGQGGANSVLVANNGAPMFSSAITVGTSITTPVVNATSSIQLNGTSINTAGTLSNVAYLNQSQTFTGSSTFNGNVAFVNATSTTFNTGSLGLNSSYFTSLLGTGLSNSGGVLTVSLSPFTTTNLAEGTNLYFTNTRAQNAISVAGTPLTYSSGVIGINQASSTASGYLSLTDYNNFSSKLSSTSLSAGVGIGYNSATGVISNTGVTSIGTLTGNVATSSLGLLTTNVAEGTNLYFTNARAQNAISVSGVPLTYASGVIGINQANTSQAGYLSAADWNTFNNKLNALAFTYPIINTSGTVSLAFGTTTQNNFSQLQQFNGNASTTGLTVTGNSYFNNVFTSGTDNITGLINQTGTGTSTFSSNISIAGNIIPATNNTYTLGSPTNSWKEVYIGPGSLYVNGQEVLSTDSSQNVVVSSDPNEDLELKTTGTANIQLNPAGTGAVLVKAGIQLSGGKSFTTSDNSAVLFPSGIAAGNLNVSGNTITATNLNGGISLTPSGSGGTYVTTGNFGIGTTSPAANLAVNGNAFVSNTLTVANITLGGAAAGITQCLHVNGAGQIYGTGSDCGTGSGGGNGSVTSVNASGGSTGLSFSGGPITTFGTLTLSGTLNVADGGTGSTTLTGLLKGNGTGSVQSAVPGIDYQTPIAIGNLTVGSNLSVSGGTGAVIGSGAVISLGPNVVTSITNDTNITGSISSNTLTLGWTGTLAPSRGGTGIGSPTAAGVLLGNYAGTGYQQIATSSLGILTTNVAEGTNLYFTNARAQAAISVAGLPLTYSAGVVGINQANTSQAGYLSAADWNTFNNKISSSSLSATAPLAYNSTTGVFSLGTVGVANGGTGSTTLGGLLKGNGTGAIVSAIPGVDYQAVGNYITALTGDITASGPGSAVATLATVNANVGSFGSSTAIPSFTVNGKGLVTGVTTSAVIAPAGTLTGSTLASNVTASSLTSVGTLSSLTVSGASSFGTVTETNATSTNFAVTGVTSSILKTNSLGQLIAAAAGTDYLAPGSLSAGTGISYNSGTGVITNSGVTSIGNLTGNVATSSLGLLTTDVAEGTNLYFTNARAQAAISVAGLPLTYSAGVIGINQANTSQAGYLSAADWNTFNNKISLSSLSATSPLAYNSGTGVFSLGTVPVANGGTGSTTLTGLLKGNGTGSVTTAIPGVDYQPAGAYLTANQNITLSGDVSGSGTTAITTTLATVNSNVGTFGSSTAIPSFTVNGKGLVTGVTTSAVIAPAGTLTGSTLASNVTASSLTSVGTLSSLTINTLSGLLYGNSGAVTAATVSSPLSFSGGALSIAQASGSTSGYLSSSDWNTFNNKISSSSLSAGVGIGYNSATGVISNTGVTSVNASGGTTGLSFSGGPVTTTGTLTLAGTLGVANGGTGATSLTGLVKGNGTGAFTAAVAGTDYLAPITGTTGQLPYFSGTNTLTATSSLFLAASGNVGIGSTSPTSPLTVLSSQNLGTITSRSNYSLENNSYVPSATFSSAAVSTLAGVSTTLDGSSVTITNSNGFNLIGDSATVTGTPSSSVSGSRAGYNAYGVYGSSALTPTVTVGAVSSYGGYFTNTDNVINDTSSYNGYAIAGINNATNIQNLSNVTTYGGYFRNNTTASTTYGAYISNTTTASLTSVGLNIDAATSPTSAQISYGLKLNGSSSATDYSLYSSGAAPSYFAGNVGIGTTTPGSLLSIAGTSFTSGVATAGGFIDNSETANSLTYANASHQLASVIVSNPLVFTNGTLSISSSSLAAGSTGFFEEGGNTFGQIANIGTNDSYNLNFETGGTTHATINNTTGYFGIATVTPSSQLSVNGSGYLTGGLGVGTTNTAAGTLVTTGNAIFGGNVGIGTTTPGSTLSIAGTSFTSGTATAGNLIDNGLTANSLTYSNGSNQLSSVALGTGLSLSGNTLSTSAYVPVGTTGQFTYFSGTNTLTATSSLYLASSGNVGIATTSPFATLSISSAGTNGNFFNIGSSQGTIFNIASTTTTVQAVNTIVYLTSGSTWTVPTNWNSASNTIEVIGGGGGGRNNNIGGGGGAYSKISNLSLTPGASVAYSVGTGGTGGTSATAGGDTYFCNSSSNCASISGTAVQVGAKGGAIGSSTVGGAGGAAASGVGTVKYSGGAGSGNGGSVGGGGGAAGPNGNGGAAGTTTGSNSGGGAGGGGADGGSAGGTLSGSPANGTAGGNNASGTGGGAGGTSGAGSAGTNGGGGGGGYTSAGAGGAGGNGTEWDSTHGSGGGGGGASGNGGIGGAGGTYGGGGGGSPNGASTAGAGGQGIIVIQYQSVAATTAQAISITLPTAGSKLGIGTSTPLSALTVSGGGTIGADYNVVAPTNGLAVEGLVGIGTTSPSAQLTIGSTYIVQPSFTKAVYTTPGVGQTFTVPAGVYSVVIKTWGAAGASGIGGNGGAGGYSSSTIAVTPGETLTVDVGGGGVNSFTAGGTNGGGGIVGGNSGAGGGGMSDVKRSSTYLIVAGGGGGGGGGAVAATGGAGGGTTGGAGVAPGSGGYAIAGGGGTQTAGGAGGGSPATSGTSGTGGNGASNGAFCGAGGGGYYGGGGGYCSNNSSAGGGGGSGYVTGTNATTSVEYSVNTTGDPDYVGSAGAAASGNGSGNAGLVVIESPTVAPTTLQNTTLAQFMNAGNGVATFLANGNIGFGTTTPLQTFAVQGVAGEDILNISTATGTPELYVKQYGNVGIGTSTPVSTLTVVGSGCFGGSGATTLCGTTAGTLYYRTSSTGTYDVAENYPTMDANLTPGTLATLDYTNAGDITTAAAGSIPLGIITTDPGLLLGGADGTATSTQAGVALAGRVPVKVSTENGPIAVGDHLMLSPTQPGVAVKAIHSGQTIGIALQAFAGDGAPYIAGDAADEGTITAFVQNQQWFAPGDLSIDGTTGFVTIGLGDSVASSTQLVVNGTVTASSTVSAPDFALSAFSLDPATTLSLFGTTTPSGLYTSTGALSLNAFADYTLTSLNALTVQMAADASSSAANASTTNALGAAVTNLTSRVTALENMVASSGISTSSLSAAVANATASSTSSSSGDLATTTIMNALSDMGVLIEKGIAQFNTLVVRDLVFSKDSDGTSAAGSGTILAGNTTVQITNSHMLATSQVSVTLTSPMTGNWYVTNKQNGSFQVTLSSAQTADVTFDYLIIQTQGQIATSTPVGASNTGSFSISSWLASLFGGSSTSSSSSNANGSTNSTGTGSEQGSGSAGANGGSGTASSTPANPNAPTVTLNGAAAMSIDQGGVFTDPGATAKDAGGNDISSSIVETGSVDVNTPGMYTLTYTATDANNNSGNVSRVVTVTATPLSAPISSGGGSSTSSGSSASSGTGTSSSGSSSTGSTGSSSAGSGGTSTDSSSSGSGSSTSTGAGASSAAGTGAGDNSGSSTSAPAAAPSAPAASPTTPSAPPAAPASSGSDSSGT